MDSFFYDDILNKFKILNTPLLPFGDTFSAKMANPLSLLDIALSKGISHREKFFICANFKYLHRRSSDLRKFVSRYQLSNCQSKPVIGEV